MQQGHNETRMIWLMSLIIVAVSAWFLNVPSISLVCGVIFVMSAMQYLDQAQQQITQVQQHIHQSVEPSSKVPLYIASVIVVIGGSVEIGWLLASGISIWIFFLLRWLQRLERQILHVHQHLEQYIHQQQPPWNVVALHTPNTEPPMPEPDPLQQSAPVGLVESIQQWIFQGNPILKVAVVMLMIGVILLLRFATEHWQFSLHFKLAIFALLSMLTAGAGWLWYPKNRSFGLAFEGLGLSSLFLCLFFAYYNAVISNLWLAIACFVGVVAVNLYLSLKQKSVELALIATFVAYIAPFTLPVRDVSAVEFVSYYLAINVAVAVLTTLQPWKILNQIAFSMTVIVGGAYAMVQAEMIERDALAVLVVLHSAIFIWLAFRYSQLLVKEDLLKFNFQPSLDIALLFGAPICAYAYLYVMYFDENLLQTAWGLAYAVLYLLLYKLSKKRKSIEFISQSYLTLCLILFSLIPPTFFDNEWSVVAWAVEGVLIFVFALQRSSVVSRYLATGLLMMATLSSLYYVVELPYFPNAMYWCLSLCYLAVVILVNLRTTFRKQMSTMSIIFLCLLMLGANIMFVWLLIDYLEGPLRYVWALCIMAVVMNVLNEFLLRQKATWTWLFPKWIGLSTLLLFALLFMIGHSADSVLVWENNSERAYMALFGLLLAVAWLRPLLGINTEKEWISVGTLMSLAVASLNIAPQMPYLSVVILPLMFCAWCYFNVEHSDWTMFWQSRSSLVLVALWMVCSQLFTPHAFVGYTMPVMNLFDLVSLGIWACFIWMLMLQLKTGLEAGLVAVLSVLSSLWLSSYILLRALHMYMGTPYNDLAIWSDATIQFSLTLLWVSLALCSMLFASIKRIRLVWLLGASILVVVTLKLVMFDLSHIDTILRVFSFLAAGSMMLCIAYMAPIPPEATKSA